ncbi:MAG: hypothetical protein QOK37_1447 [Thermoanaerobaculia bacterium]|jgi:hypothetical protein|nr:hypothetical protein [Thermoanaerobaculia bacterium]
MKRNFNELFSKMKPEAQERVKARSSELLQEMTQASRYAETNNAAETEGALHHPDESATPSEEVGAERASANRNVAVHSSK